MILPPKEESLRDLFARVIDNAKAYLKAELTLIRTNVSVRVGQVAPAIGFVIVAILIVQSALTVLIAALGLAFAAWIGIAGGLAVAALIGLAIAALLGWLSITRFRKIKP